MSRRTERGHAQGARTLFRLRPAEMAGEQALSCCVALLRATIPSARAPSAPHGEDWTCVHPTGISTTGKPALRRSNPHFQSGQPQPAAAQVAFPKWSTRPTLAQPALPIMGNPTCAGPARTFQNGKRLLGGPKGHFHVFRALQGRPASSCPHSSTQVAQAYCHRHRCSMRGWVGFRRSTGFAGCGRGGRAGGSRRCCCRRL